MLWTQPTAHLGNFLYEWMHAYCWQQQGMDIVCLRTPSMDPWVEVFGDRTDALLVEPDDVRLTDRRELGLHNEFAAARDPPGDPRQRPRLILANSTFSYWGGYLSRWCFRDPTQVVAPWFHILSDLGGAAWQLDPEWSVVRDIPSGWALPDQPG